jgi:hypothetical protein
MRGRFVPVLLAVLRVGVLVSAIGSGVSLRRFLGV